MTGQPSHNLRDKARRPERRAFMQGAAAGTLAFTLGGAEVLLTPHDARAQGVPLRVLDPGEARLLAAIGEALATGARDQGIANFVDQQCSVPPHQALLSLRISGARPPFADFYRAALAEVARQCTAAHGKPFEDLSPAEQHAFINRMRQSGFADWRGPPQPRVYGILRDDAVDVAYGTVAGFERLGVPYMPHIDPQERW